MHINEAPRTTDEADAVLDAVGIMDNPYFRELQNGAMTLEQFRQSQAQFYHAVSYYAVGTGLPFPLSPLR